MSVLLFFMLGWFIEAPTIYWVVFGIYAFFKAIVYFCKLVNSVVETFKED